MWRPDVRNAAALAVEAAPSRRPGDVGAQTVCSAEAGALADEHDDSLGLSRLPDVVADGHARLMRDDDVRRLPVGRSTNESLRQGRAVAQNSRCGQAVREDDGEIAPHARQAGPAVLRQKPAEVRSHQIGAPVGRLARHLHDLTARDLVPQRALGQGRLDGVFRQRVAELEIQGSRGGNGRAHAPKTHARNRRRAEPAQAICGRRPIVHCRAASAGNARRSGRVRSAESRPEASVIPTEASQTSNSGAGRSPRTWRRYNASWKLVD